MRQSFSILGCTFLRTAVCFILTAFIVSCSDVFDSNEEFSSRVKNSQLESPEITADCFKTIVNSDGSETIQLSWPIVEGAGGYKLNVSIVDNPLSPVVVISDSIVDGTSVKFDKIEDTDYKVSILSLGNKRYNNKEALSPSVYAYSTMIEAAKIPVGTDVGEFILANLKDDPSIEQAFELEAGQAYTIDTVVDLGLNNVTVRGSGKINHPLLTVGVKGGFKTQGGFKMKFLNVDAEQMKQVGLLTFSDEPSETISSESLGYKAKGASQDHFIIEKPIIFQECNIKEIKNSIVFANKKNYSCLDLRIVDCMIQLDNAGSNTFINFYGGSTGAIKNLTIKGSTIWNIQENSAAYFLRFSNSSNADPGKLFGSTATAVYLLENNTLCRVMTGKDFANNLRNSGSKVGSEPMISTIARKNIFWDVFRIYQFAQTQTYREMIDNFIFWKVAAEQSNDISRTDSEGRPLCIKEDPGFAGEPYMNKMDFSQINCGVDFTPSSAIVIEAGSGDKRWLSVE